MQSTQKLASAIRGLMALVDDEAKRNPAFAERLEAIVGQFAPPVPRTGSTKKVAEPAESLPDVFRFHQEKGDQEFRFWLRSFNLRTLKALVKANGFDPGKATQRWTEPDKFIELIADQTAARLRRGTSFLTSKSSRNEEPND